MMPSKKWNYQADVIFTDPPWNLGNLNTFYMKAQKQERHKSFERFYLRLFECIADINPRSCYVNRMVMAWPY